MSYFTELAAMLGGCLAYYLWDAPFSFMGSGLLGLVLAALSAVGAVQFGKSIRSTYRRGPLFYLTCLMVGGITLVSVPLFRALKYMAPVAEKSVSIWGLAIRSNGLLQQRAFEKGYDAVEALGIEDFSRYPRPDAGGNRFPTSQRESQETAAGVYVGLSMEDWRHSRPFLSSLLGAEKGPGREGIAGDMDQYFAAGHRDYMVSRGMELAESHIRRQLAQQSDRVVFWFRCLFGGLALLCQAIPLAAIAYESHRQLRPTPRQKFARV